MNKQFIGAILISISAILFFMFVMPKFDELSAMREARDQRVQLLADSQRAHDNLVKLLSQYESSQASIQKVYTALPKNRQLDYVTSSIHAAAQQAGLELKSLGVGDVAKKKGDYEITELQLELSGRYVGLMQFLSNLESSLRLYDIQKLEVGEASGAAGILTITVTLTAYSIQ